MPGRYLNKETISKKYNSINGLINGGRSIGMIYGITYITLSLGQQVEQILLGGGLAAGSYYTGKFLSKLNKDMMNKQINKLHKEKKGELERAVA